MKAPGAALRRLSGHKKKRGPLNFVLSTLPESTEGEDKPVSSLCDRRSRTVEAIFFYQPIYTAIFVDETTEGLPLKDG